MSVEKLLKTAAYFEDRANRSRRPEDKDRFLAVAKKYPVRAEAVRKREADLVGTLTAPSGQWIAAAFGFVRNLGRPRRLRLYYTTSVRFPPINPDVAAPPKVVCPPALSGGAPMRRRERRLLYAPSFVPHSPAARGLEYCGILWPAYGPRVRWGSAAWEPLLWPAC